jgi:hypothetical protein
MINHTVYFLARISKDGRIVIPKVNMNQPQEIIIEGQGFSEYRVKRKDGTYI